jgi:hypothetical protein
MLTEFAHSAAISAESIGLTICFRSSSASYSIVHPVRVRVPNRRGT